MKKFMNIVMPIMYLIFILLSFIFNFEPGQEIGTNFFDFVKTMIGILPFAFILIGLFEVWIDKKTVEKYFGHASSFMGYFWAIVLSSTTVGGAYVGFPVGYTLYNKGAKLSIVLTYIGSSALTRIPMTIFEASFIGIKFSVLRLSLSIPLIILSSMFIDHKFEKKKSNKSIPSSK